MERKRKRFYSEKFKLRVIEAVISGKVSKEEARTVYGIKGKSAILNWMRELGFENKLEKEKELVVDPTNMNETSDMTISEKRIKELESALNRERYAAFPVD